MEVGELDELEVHRTPPVPLRLGVGVGVGVVSRRRIVEEAQSVALVVSRGSRSKRGTEAGGRGNGEGERTKGNGMSTREAVGRRSVHPISALPSPPVSAQHQLKVCPRRQRTPIGELTRHGPKLVLESTALDESKAVGK